MKRRTLLLGGASAVALGSSPALGYHDDGFFHWRKPGGDPYRGTLEDALRDFSDLLAPDPDVAEELYRKVQQGRGTPGLVFPGWQVTRMMFAAKRREPNVIVDSSDFAAWGQASKNLMMYTAERVTGSEARFYAIFRPAVCGNWSIRLGSRICILDRTICDQGCRQRRLDQYRT